MRAKVAASLTSVPLLTLLAKGSMDTPVIVAGAVLVAYALLSCVLIMHGGVAPWLEWGPLKLGFVTVRRTPRRDRSPPEDPAARGDDDDEVDRNDEASHPHRQRR